MRFYARMLHEDQMTFRQNGEWGKALLGEEISEGSREANARLMTLTAGL